MTSRFVRFLIAFIMLLLTFSLDGYCEQIVKTIKIPMVKTLWQVQYQTDGYPPDKEISDFRKYTFFVGRGNIRTDLIELISDWKTGPIYFHSIEKWLVWGRVLTKKGAERTGRLWELFPYVGTAVGYLVPEVGIYAVSNDMKYLCYSVLTDSNGAGVAILDLNSGKELKRFVFSSYEDIFAPQADDNTIVFHPDSQAFTFDMIKDVNGDTRLAKCDVDIKTLQFHELSVSKQHLIMP